MSLDAAAAVQLASILLMCLGGISCHGRLVEPPSRASMWRYGYNTPADYLDNQLWCGGFATQWQLNGGKCGVCGDTWNATEPRDHELGGRYVPTATIVRRYSPGGTIPVIVEITAAHRGFFEFRICPLELDAQRPGGHREASWDCLDKHQLNIRGSTGRRYAVPHKAPRLHAMDVELPTDLLCDHCLLQWKYHTGNSWGQDSTGTACLGCGPQEEFYGCADIAVLNTTRHLTITSTTSPPTHNRPSPTTIYSLIQTPQDTSPPPSTITDKLEKQQSDMNSSTTESRMITSSNKMVLVNVAWKSGRDQPERSQAPTPVAVEKIQKKPDRVELFGHSYSVAVYGDKRKEHLPALDISASNLISMEPEGSLYIVPAWFVIPDHRQKKLNVVAPEMFRRMQSMLTASLKPTTSTTVTDSVATVTPATSTASAGV